jgi:hypothetical protein
LPEKVISKIINGSAKVQGQRGAVRLDVLYSCLMRLGPWILTRGDVLGGLFVVAVLGLMAFIFIRYPDFKAATGFGPDWDCARVSNGDPICVKKAAK